MQWTGIPTENGGLTPGSTLEECMKWIVTSCCLVNKCEWLMRTSGSEWWPVGGFPWELPFPSHPNFHPVKGILLIPLFLPLSIPRLQTSSGDTIFHSALLSALLCRLALVCFWSKVCPYMGCKNYLTMKYWFVEQKAMSLHSEGFD